MIKMRYTLSSRRERERRPLSRASYNASKTAVCLSAYLPIRIISPPASTKEMANTFLLILSVVIVGMSYQMPTNNGIIRGGGNAMFVVKMDLVSIWMIVIPLSFIMAFVVKASPAVVVCCLNADQIFKCVPAFLESHYGNWIRKLTRDA